MIDITDAEIFELYLKSVMMTLQLVFDYNATTDDVRNWFDSRFGDDLDLKYLSMHWEPLYIAMNILGIERGDTAYHQQLELEHLKYQEMIAEIVYGGLMK